MQKLKDKLKAKATATFGREVEIFFSFLFFFGFSCWSFPLFSYNFCLMQDKDDSDPENGTTGESETEKTIKLVSFHFPFPFPLFTWNDCLNQSSVSPSFQKREGVMKIFLLCHLQVLYPQQLHSQHLERSVSPSFLLSFLPLSLLLFKFLLLLLSIPSHGRIFWSKRIQMKTWEMY